MDQVIDILREAGYTRPGLNAVVKPVPYGACPNLDQIKICPSFSSGLNL